MDTLAELQASFTRALTTGRAELFDAALVGGRQPRKRLAVHLRHYETSLTSALCDKYPACAWLIGADLLRAAASAYLRARAPTQLCIAEYGADFGRFLGTFGPTRSLPYLESFAALEWAVGQASIAADGRRMSWIELTSAGPERLLDSALVLQPGLRYVQSAWRIDELMTTYLRGTAPELFRLREAPTAIQVHGTRGNLSLAPLDRATFAFRSALAAGRVVCDAAADALELDVEFDTGRSLRLLANAGLVAGCLPVAQQSRSTEPPR